MILEVTVAFSFTLLLFEYVPNDSSSFVISLCALLLMLITSYPPKTHPLDNDLSLDVGQPSTNDAPEQYSTFRKTPTKEQNRISDEIVAADSGESIVKEAKSFHEPIDEVAARFPFKNARCTGVCA